MTPKTLWFFDQGAGNTSNAPGMEELVYMSEPWQDRFLHAVAEAARLGLKIGVHNSPGWSASGGPWIDAEHSMQMPTLSRIEVEGNGREQTLVLPKPWHRFGWYRDEAVVAYPAGETFASANPGITASSPIDGALLMDGRWETRVTLPDVEGDQERYIEIAFDEPKTVEGLRFRDFHSPAPARWVDLEVSEDGVQFQKVARLDYYQRSVKIEGSLIYGAFEPVTGKFFRLRFESPQGGPYILGELELMMRPAIKNLPYKAIYQTPLSVSAHDWGASRTQGPAIPVDQVIDLTDRLDESGQLNWTVPAGRWIVLRVGHTSNGYSPRPLPGAVWKGTEYRSDDGRPDDGISHSLECDKLSKAATEMHYRKGVGRLVERSGSLVGRVLDTVTIDSYEPGAQNWTAGLPGMFKERRGYAMTPFLPLLLTGAVVEDMETSERFLEDFRQTIQELCLENHYGHFRELVNRDGLQLEFENYHKTFIDTLDIAGVIDVSVGHFWSMHPRQQDALFDAMWVARHANSGSQVYGHSAQVPAEAFTSSDPYTQSPKGLKAKGDLMFTAGFNQFIFHVYEHQQLLDKCPGGYWTVGLHMNRHNTWWTEGASWVKYLRRSQALLQQGKGVGKVAILTPEYHPAMMSVVQEYDQRIRRQIPYGFGFLYSSQQGLLENGRIENGTLGFPLGAGYRMVVLPHNSDISSPELLQRLKELLQAGVSVYATARPRRAHSETDHMPRSAAVRELADELWGAVDGKTVTHCRVGEGFLIQGVPLAKALEIAGIQPDLEPVHVDGSAFETLQDSAFPSYLYPVNFIHRRTENEDIYFVANITGEEQSLIGRFGVTGMAPQWWDPVTGKTEKLAAWRETGGATELPLHLGPSESAFIIFSPADAYDPIVSLKHGNTEWFPSVQGGNAGGTPAPAKWRLIRDEEGGVHLRTGTHGTFTATTAGGQKRHFNAPVLPGPVTIEGSWQVTFDPGLGAPPESTFDKLMSWSEHPEAGIRYFSGHATYRKKITIPESVFAENRRIHLDLGEVEVAATVKVNGVDCGTLWYFPYTADVTDALKPGVNGLEIRVVNTWPNRLIGDHRQPGEPIAYSASKMYEADDPLIPAGLLGPVKLRFESVLPKAADQIESGVDLRSTRNSLTLFNGADEMSGTWGASALEGPLVQEARVFKNESGETLPYRLYKPDNYQPDANIEYPLVVGLHGAGGRGTNNVSGGIHAINVLTSVETRNNYPAFIITPQCPLAEQWVNTPWGKGSYSLSDVPISDSLRLVLEIITSVQHEFNIDPARIYVTGQSMGGYGTWDIILRNPRLFAAAVPVCGAGDPSRAEDIAHLPIWAFHGSDDQIVPVSGSREMVAALESCDGEIRYSEYADVKHGAWGPAWDEEELMSWIFSQRNGYGE